MLPHAVSALAQVADVGEVRWWSRSPGRAREAAAGLDLPVTVCKAVGEAAAGADLVLTATPSREPLLTAWAGPVPASMLTANAAAVDSTAAEAAIRRLWRPVDIRGPFLPPGIPPGPAKITVTISSVQ